MSSVGLSRSYQHSDFHDSTELTGDVARASHQESVLQPCSTCESSSGARLNWYELTPYDFAGALKNMLLVGWIPDWLMLGNNRGMGQS